MREEEREKDEIEIEVGSVSVKGKVHPRTGHGDPYGEQVYSATLSFTSALDGVGGRRHPPSALLPANTRYPLYRRGMGPSFDLDGCRKSRPHRTVQPVANHYTD